MKKLKRFILSPFCKPLCNEVMVKIIDGTDHNLSCTFNSASESCSGSCSHAGHTDSSVYDYRSIYRTLLYYFLIL